MRRSWPFFSDRQRYQWLLSSYRESNEFNIVLTWFKGTMNRYLVPGTKNDNVLVIHGMQGRGKSTFFKKISFSHTSGFGTSDKDDLLKYHKYALVEFEELDGLTKKADVTAIKKFFSSDEDDIRPPYGRESILLKRAFSCCGSANTGNFLKDSTGNRRFIIIHPLSVLLLSSIALPSLLTLFSCVACQNTVFPKEPHPNDLDSCFKGNSLFYKVRKVSSNIICFSTCGIEVSSRY